MTRQPLREYRFSLRFRVTSWYVSLLSIALVVFSFSVYLGIRTYLKLSLQRALSSVSHAIANDFLSKLPAKDQVWVLGEVRESYASSASDHYVRLSVGKETLYQTPDMRDPTIKVSDIALPRPLDIEAFRSQTVDGQAVMINSLPYKAADGRVFEIEAGTSLYSMQQTLNSLAKILIFASILTLISAAMGGYFLMNRPLRPLVVLTEKAASIGRNELGKRLPVIPTGDELEGLTHSLNGMIARLEEALDHNHRFSADASHELRTPLTIMRGEMEEILQLDDLPQQAVDNLASTLEEIDRMSRIVNSLMAITRLDAGGERLDMTTIDLSTLVRTTMDHMRLLAEEKGLPVTCACERQVFVYADPMMLKQVLVNLIDNAIKYTPLQSRVPAIESDVTSIEHSTREAAEEDGAIDVTVSASATHAVLRITDHGMGISPETLPFVFDRFYRADYARSRGAGGVGLGLAIVKAIVAAHNGTISITSTPGRGSAVFVHLPLAPTFNFPAEEPTATRIFSSQ